MPPKSRRIGDSVVDHLDRCVDKLADERRRANDELAAIRAKMADVKKLIRDIDRRHYGLDNGASRFRLCDLEYEDAG